MSSNYYLFLQAIPMTILVTVLAFALGALIGIPLCAMRVAKNAGLRWISLSLIIILRSVPPIVWLFLLYFGLGSGILQIGAIPASVIALGLITGANMAEVYRGGLASLPRGQWDAVKALSMPSVSIFFDVIAPQLFRVVLPSGVSYMIGLLKDSAIISTVGVMDIAYVASFISRKNFDGLTAFAVAAAIYICISVPVALLARNADEKLRQRVTK